MRYTKPALSVEDQVQRLRDRGMQGDPQVMAQRLAVVSYYRLTAYWHPFRNADRTFADGTLFDTVWDRYVFDRHLRLLVLDAIERIEITIRTQLAQHHGLAHGPFAYADTPASLPYLRDQSRRSRFENELAVQYRNSKEIFVEHFDQTYGDTHQHLPVWMACEIMSFGCMLTFFRGCHANLQRAVAKPLGIHPTVLESWLLALNVVRNICAHHGRLWNRILGIKPKLPDKDDQWHTPVRIDNRHVFAILTICKYCLDRIAPQSHWPIRLHTLLARFPAIPQDHMGIPVNWLDCPIWSGLNNDPP